MAEYTPSLNEGRDHDLDHMLICRRCGQGLSVREIVGGAQRCPVPEATSASGPMPNDVLIQGLKRDARNRMRYDPRVWHEALEGALDEYLPSMIEAVRQEEREKAAQIASSAVPRDWPLPRVQESIAARILAQGKEQD